jgi:hypothetical protein
MQCNTHWLQVGNARGPDPDGNEGMGGTADASASSAGAPDEDERATAADLRSAAAEDAARDSRPDAAEPEPAPAPALALAGLPAAAAAADLLAACTDNATT